MAAKPVKIAYLADTGELRASLKKAETAMEATGNTAKTAGAKVDAAFDSTAQHADNVASKGSQAAGALSGLGDLIGGPWGAAMQTSGVAMQAAADAGDLLNVVTESAIIKKAKDVVTTTAHAVATGAQTVATVAQTAAQKALNLAMKANPIGLVITAITLLVGAIILAYKKSDTFREKVDAAWGAIKTATRVVFEWVRDKITTVFETLRTLFLNFTGPGLIIKHWDTIKDKTREAWETVKGFVVDKFNAAKERVVEIAGNLVGFFGGLGSKISSKTAGMWDGLKESFRSAINAVIGWWNNLSLKLDIPDKIPGLPDSFTIATPNIPFLASGGIVTRPTLAVVGEAGPEAVVPLSRMGPLGMGGGKLEVTVELPAAQMDALARKIAEATAIDTRLIGQVVGEAAASGIIRGGNTVARRGRR